MIKLFCKCFLFVLAVSGSISFSSVEAQESVSVITDFNTGTGYSFSLPMSCSLMTGNNNSGLIVAGGYQNRVIKRIESYSSGHIANISDPGIPVKFLTGENRYGPVVVSEDGYTVKYMDSYAANVWKTLPRPPFKIKGIVGNNQTGLIIHNDKELAYLSSYSGSWIRKRLFEESSEQVIGAIKGNNTAGIWVLASPSLFVVKKYSEPMYWVTFFYTDTGYNLPPSSFTGNPAEGLIAATYSGNSVWGAPDGLYTHYGVEGDRFRLVRNSSSFYYPSNNQLVGDPRKGIAYCSF